MKALGTLVAATTLVVSMTAMARPNLGKFADTFAIERYTLIGNTMLEYDWGVLHENGQYQVISSQYFTLPYLGFTADDFAPISGSPIVEAQTFDLYSQGGLLPKWKRSQRCITSATAIT